MNEIKATQTGLLKVYGSKYAVLLPETSNVGLPIKTWHASVMHVENRTVNVLVASVHFVERVHEGIITGETIFVTPRWVTLNGDFIIEWLPTPKEITILVPVDGETVNE